MYGGLLPATGGFLLNPLRLVYILVALVCFGGAWVTRKLGSRRGLSREE